MRTDKLFSRYEFLAAASCIAAHANAQGQGFRQRDVRFYLELFSNWVESTLDGAVLSLNNTQVSRYMEALIEEGYARRVSRSNKPMYRLSRIGLIELLTRLVEPPASIQAQHFFFLLYFVDNYRPRIMELIKSEGKRFPIALKLEVDSLLDARALAERQLEHIEVEIRKLDERIEDSKKGGRLAGSLFKAGQELSEVAQRIEREYPYELNSQKPLRELISDIPEDLGRWELEHGAVKRISQLWKPSKAMLLQYKSLVKGMLEVQ